MRWTRGLVVGAMAVCAVAAVWLWRARAERDDGRGLARDDGGVDRVLDCDPCRGGRSWSGSWTFPRGGPYVFFLDTLDGSSGTLSIDGKQVLAAAPRRETRERKLGMPAIRVVYPAGVHAVSVTHSGEGRFALYWLPPGRRGDPEIVPPEALRPVPPAQAGPSGDEAFRPEAIAYTVTLAVLVALALFFLRPLLPARRDAIAMLAIFAVAAAPRLAIIHAFGQTWDEDVYWSSGRNYLVALANLDFRPRMWNWNFEHPPVAKYLLGLGALWHDGYGPARAIMALVSSGSCVVAYLIGRHLYSRRVGAGAGLLCAFAPHLIAHGAVAGLETPSTFFVTLATWLFLRRSYVLAGVAGGLAAGSRFIAALVFFAMAASALCELAASLRGERRMTRLRDWLHLGLAPVAGFATLVAIWPRLWMDGPIAGLRIAYHRLNVQHTPEWFFGVKILTPVPKGYFFAYFGAGMVPAVLLGLLLCAVFVVPRRWREALRLLPFLLAPFGMMFSPVIQSGLRYLLPAVPPACVLAAAGIEAAAARLRERLVWPALALAAATSLASFLLVCPYPLDYYNALFGGPRAAYARRFVFGWWGEGIQAALAHVNGVAPRGARVFYDLFPSHVAWLRDDFVIVRKIDEADYVLLNNFQWRGSAAAPTGFHEVFAETVRGAPLVKVFARDRD